MALIILHVILRTLKAIFLDRHNEQSLQSNCGMDQLNRPNMETHEADLEAGAGMIAHFILSIILSRCIYFNDSVYEYVTQCILPLARSKCMWLVILAHSQGLPML